MKRAPALFTVAVKELKPNRVCYVH